MFISRRSPRPSSRFALVLVAADLSDAQQWKLENPELADAVRVTTADRALTDLRGLRFKTAYFTERVGVTTTYAFVERCTQITDSRDANRFIVGA